MTIEAMKQALDALEQHGTPLLNHEDVYAASLTALRQAIAEAEKQEPVAWIDRTCLKNLSDDFEPTIGKRPVSEYDIPLYIHPQPKSEWVGKEVAPKELSQKFLEEIVESRVVALVAKLREKNGC